MKGEKMLNLMGQVDESLIEEAMTAQPTRRKLGRTVWAVAIAAVLVLSLTVGAAAAGAFGPIGDLFAPLFGASESQAAIIERLGQPIGVSDTQGGVTVTAEAAINDGKNLVVLYSVTKDDGSALVSEGTERFDQLAWNAGMDGDTLHFAFSQREPNDPLGDFDYTPGDSTARIIQKFTAEAGMPDRFTGYLSDLEYWCDGTDGYTEVHRIASGGEKKDDFWWFDFPIVPAKEAVTIQAQDAELHVSPLALEAQFTVQGRKELANQQVLALRLKDGRVLDYSSVTDDNGIRSPMSRAQYDEQQDTTLFTLGGVFDEVIPLEEMDCVIFNGTAYPVK